MGRKRVGVSRWRRWRSYRASALCRHRNRVRWLLAQRTRLRNYLRRFAGFEGG
ncbi:hypothetical protein [Microbulbifer thermotolerans]|uniref:Uncharacterized protein n=1 Tax=Microbulbifer thermotolerans TaxID=252514 RepID=A0AB35HUZ4_MICTH|nr:hypothetical protein [Microbulbifer thermotolerans]MCX2778217.1 hypothetical protein [Microbulbifer thermotolerans]MCX2783191.1 hypothetical protein [Microbulbifer thermotolerans]MCX2794207.1 hypothetical protein [Microbulbifer thermotolerans]MCX2800771.1 hypothetical protein [Microbulbifer thermotolerans]MCX2803558.1 hypothetical protein [Microbulbifer thermotolerans]